MGICNKASYGGNLKLDITYKESTLILEVDLHCERCYTKIQKVLCKLQPKESIKKIDYDNKKNTVTISGPFDPQKLSAKLMCKACDVIRSIEIKEEKKPEKPVKRDAPPSGSSTTNVNFKFNNMCVICYPWPCRCSNPTTQWGVVRQQQPQEPAEQKKPDKETKPKDEEANKAPPAAPPPQWSSTTNVNLEFNNICAICYPWPCRCQQPKQPEQPHRPPHQPCWSPCGGPSSCGGGCGSCRGAGGMHGCQPQQMCCPGSSSCRGCNGCKIIRETKFSYEEYPHNTCKLM